MTEKGFNDLPGPTKHPKASQSIPGPTEHPGAYRASQSIPGPTEHPRAYKGPRKEGIADDKAKQSDKSKGAPKRAKYLKQGRRT